MSQPYSKQLMITDNYEQLDAQRHVYTTLDREPE